MPSRVIRGEINASRSLSRVGLEADLTFRSLLVSVDDFGRCEADPLMLKATLFPRRAAVTPEMVAGWVAELVAEGCVRSYEVDGVAYLQLTGHERHRSNSKRAERSKFPDPPPISEAALAVPDVPEIPPGISGEPRAANGAPESPADPRPSVVCRVAGDEVAGSGREEIPPSDAVSWESADSTRVAASDADEVRGCGCEPCAGIDPPKDLDALKRRAWRDYPHLRQNGYAAVACAVWVQALRGAAPADTTALDCVPARRIALGGLVTHLRAYLADPSVSHPSLKRFMVVFGDYGPPSGEKRNRKDPKGLAAIDGFLAEAQAEEAAEAERRAAAGGDT